MPEAKLLTLEEVKVCEQAYILYEKEDPVVHLFKRLKTYDDSFIQFDRPLNRFASSRPCLFTEYYEKQWFAFNRMPSAEQVREKKKLMKTYDEHWGSLYGTDSVP